MRIQNYSLILGEKGIKLLRNAEQEGILEGRNWEKGHGGSAGMRDGDAARALLFHRTMASFPKAPGWEVTPHRDHHLVKSMKAQGSIGSWGSVNQSSLPPPPYLLGKVKPQCPPILMNSQWCPLSGTRLKLDELQRSRKPGKMSWKPGGSSGMAAEDPGSEMASLPTLQPSTWRVLQPMVKLRQGETKSLV